MKPVNLLLGITLAFFAAYSLIGCPPPNPKPPEVDASDAASDAEPPVETGSRIKYPQCVRACAVLERYECPEAKTPDGGKNCYGLCADAEDNGKFNLKPLCIGAAMNIEEVRACKSVRCLK